MSDAYDPTAPEGESRSGSQYMSKKDVRNVLIILFVLAIGLVPIYKIMEKNSERARCVTNMQAIQAAMNLYATEYDDHLPPVFAEGPGGGYPFVDPKRNVVDTWASVISGNMKTRASFACPSASADEGVPIFSKRGIDTNNVEDRNRTPGQERLDYGMYAPYSCFSTSLIADPNSTIIIAETSNMGAHDSFDPMPYKDSNGNVVPFDGCAIAWDNSNNAPNSATKAVTRLAFYGVKGGAFKSDGDARHGSTIHAITATGSLVNLTQDNSLVKSRSGSIVGAWSVPASVGR